MSAFRGEISVVGLGPGDSSLLTNQTRELLASSRVFLRTRSHPALASLPESRTWTSFDELICTARADEDACARIVEWLLLEAVTESLVYAVPGHPLFGDATVQRLLEVAPTRNVQVCIVPAVSVLDQVAVALHIDPLKSNLQLVDALELVSANDADPFAGGSLPVSPLRPALIGHIHSSQIIPNVARSLRRLYRDNQRLILLRLSGKLDLEPETMTLHALAETSVSVPVLLFLPAVDPLEHDRVAEGLQRIIALLRAPGGCPWDREQTHQSLTRHMLEEAYEAVHAIEAGTPGDLAEELGDVLLQVYLHAQIAEETGEFTLEDVFEALTAKLVRRHPHVFGERTIESAGEVVKAWDQIKQDERAKQSEEANGSLFDSVPPALPALARAQTFLRRARSHGIDVDLNLTRDDRSDEEGTSDLEFDLASRIAEQVARAQEHDVDAEGALRRWTDEFERMARGEGAKS